MKRTLVLIPLLCMACGAHEPSGIRATEVSTADVQQTTGGTNADGLKYTGYNTGDEISKLKEDLGNTEENKSFAQQIIDGQIDVPKTIDPAVQQQILQQQSDPKSTTTTPP